MELLEILAKEKYVFLDIFKQTQNNQKILLVLLYNLSSLKLSKLWKQF